MKTVEDIMTKNPLTIDEQKVIKIQAASVKGEYWVSYHGP